MRLWHHALIPKLPRQQLLGQHRECCALRGKGWGKKHATVDYVFEHPYYMLYHYHLEVMSEMESRGYIADGKWLNAGYRGKSLGTQKYLQPVPFKHYPEHNAAYYDECVENLKNKGVRI